MGQPLAELELGLYRVQADTYHLELRFTDPASDAETAPRRTACPLDPRALLPLLLDQRAYGQALAAQVFADPDARAYLRAVRTAVDSADRVLRLRILIGPSAAELHALRWELLCDPDAGAPFATSERVLLSRYLPSQDWRAIRLRPKAALRALVAISAPSDLADYGLAPIDLTAEEARARESLGAMAVEVLGRDQPLTVAVLDEALRRRPDILYLVAHGAFSRRREPFLMLQEPDGRLARVRGDELAQRIGEMHEPPRLIVLGSCESAGSGDAPTGDPEAVPSSAEAALAPRLASAGVPAILAMQGQIGIDTAMPLLARFFRELMEDGQVDRALAVARGLVRERPDAWMPALFLRLKGGRIWYEPGFGRAGGAGEEDAVKWAALVNDIENRRFTPIVGFGLAEGVYGSTEDLAQRLAAAAQFPLAPYQRTDLPQVSQYLLVTQGSSSYPLDAVKEQVRHRMLALHQASLAPEDRDLSLSKLLRKVGALRRQDAQDPYRLLASLPARVFVTATPDTLLTESLVEAGKRPDERFAFWKRGVTPPEPYEREPTVSEPLVYHMLGHFKEPDSMVLTQDDYFDYLIGASRNHALVPNVVRHALTSSSLLFLGFQLTDWSFRVLFRLIVAQEGGAVLRKRFPHVAVQVDPDGNPLIDTAQARRYLVDCYGMDDISLFWGGGDELLRQLAPRLRVRTPAEWDGDAEGDDDF